MDMAEKEASILRWTFIMVSVFSPGCWGGAGGSLRGKGGRGMQGPSPPASCQWGWGDRGGDGEKQLLLIITGITDSWQEINDQFTTWPVDQVINDKVSTWAADQWFSGELNRWPGEKGEQVKKVSMWQVTKWPGDKGDRWPCSRRRRSLIRSRRHTSGWKDLKND